MVGLRDCPYFRVYFYDSTSVFFLNFLGWKRLDSRLEYFLLLWYLKRDYLQFYPLRFDSTQIENREFLSGSGNFSLKTMTKKRSITYLDFLINAYIMSYVEIERNVFAFIVQCIPLHLQHLIKKKYQFSNQLDGMVNVVTSRNIDYVFVTYLLRIVIISIVHACNGQHACFLVQMIFFAQASSSCGFESSQKLFFAYCLRIMSTIKLEQNNVTHHYLLIKRDTS